MNYLIRSDNIRFTQLWDADANFSANQMIYLETLKTVENAQVTNTIRHKSTILARVLLLYFCISIVEAKLADWL